MQLLIKKLLCASTYTYIYTEALGVCMYVILHATMSIHYACMHVYPT